MAKVLFFNFDGTDNEPADAMQEKNFLGTTEDNSITNILKLHLLLGGNLQQKTGNTLLENGSRSFYYNGIGTYGNYFERKFNAGLASESADVSTIIRLARKDFTEHFVEKGGYDFVVVTGFSRGAALARRFASTINHRVSDKQIIIEAVFDTVAAIGLPNMSQKDRPTSDVVFEHGHTLPSNVLKALHLVSLDDKRKAFQPTLMNQDGRVREIWFPGAHSDVGGGYNFDGLSDNALRYLLDWFEDQQELGITFKSSRSVQYGDIFGDSEKLAIGPDDVQIDSNPFGVSHQQDRTPLIDRLTLTDRLCCVIKDDKVIEREAPLVHWSVAERVGGDRNYRPISLRNTAHRVIYPDETINAFVGSSEHKLKYKSRLRIPDGEGLETRVYAHLKYNRTGIYLEQGKSYKIEVVDRENHLWRDGSVKNLDGEGWDRDDVKLGFVKEGGIALAEPFRRVTKDDAQWFTLCAGIGDDDKEAFVIGNLLENFTPDASGELCPFANDLDGYYGNNSGYLTIRVTLL
jgi:CO dehydrogenase/acetyl-CoA synthase epsilon subunit